MGEEEMQRMEIMDPKQFERDVRFVENNLGRKLRLLGRNLWIIRHVIALYRYMVDPQVHWVKKILVVAALVYFITPVDMIPDWIPVVGYTDDAGFIAAVIKSLGKSFVKYYG
jgi:uncharacterized membrane protein YkvA (DUF1232 family)